MRCLTLPSTRSLPKLVLVLVLVPLVPLKIAASPPRRLAPLEPRRRCEEGRPLSVSVDGGHPGSVSHAHDVQLPRHLRLIHGLLLALHRD